MISKLAKSMALFFADKNLIAAEDKEVYAYGAELLLSTVFNLVIALVIALIKIHSGSVWYFLHHLLQ